MHLKTILNRVERHKSFVYGKQQLVENEDDLGWNRGGVKQSSKTEN
jgi:hypothetical protein